MKIVTERELVSKGWMRQNPRHCPVKLRDGDNKSVGPCYHYLNNGYCPDHGHIYEVDEIKKEKNVSNKKGWFGTFIGFIYKKIKGK